MSIRSVVSRLLRLPPRYRRSLLFCVDFILLPLSVWLSFWLRYPQPAEVVFFNAGTWLSILSLVVGLPLYVFTGQYRGLTLYASSFSLYALLLRNVVLLLILYSAAVVFSLPLPPISNWILLWFLITGLSGLVRFALRDILLNFLSLQHTNQLRVAIYGAGEAGAQLAAALRLAGNHKIVTFLDDNPDYWDRTIYGLPIQPPQLLSNITGSIDQVLLAIPSMSRRDRRRIVDDLQRRGISVLQVPSVDDLTSGLARIDSLRPIAIEDLLGRDVVSVDSSIFGVSLRGAVVCVTGVRWFYRQRTCRQIFLIHPQF